MCGCPSYNEREQATEAAIGLILAFVELVYVQSRGRPKVGTACLIVISPVHPELA